MNLNEAIKHAMEQAAKLEGTRCGEEHQQIADWLKELKRIKDLSSRPTKFASRSGMVIHLDFLAFHIRDVAGMVSYYGGMNQQWQERAKGLENAAARVSEMAEAIRKEQEGAV